MQAAIRMTRFLPSSTLTSLSYSLFIRHNKIRPDISNFHNLHSRAQGLSQPIRVKRSVNLLWDFSRQSDYNRRQRMPDNIPTPPPTSPGAASAKPAQAGTSFDISEEFGTAKKNLPPLKILLIAVAVVAVVAAIASFLQRPHSSTHGSIDDIVSVEVPDQNQIMVAINVSFQNNGAKPYWIHTIK